MTTTIYICGNSEAICDGYTDDRTGAWQEEIATVWVQAVADVIRDASLDVDYELNSTFRDWHGGRMVQFYQCCGWVALPKDAPQEVVDLAWKAVEAGDKARDAYIAELEAEADRFDAQEEAVE